MQEAFRTQNPVDIIAVVEFIIKTYRDFDDLQNATRNISGFGFVLCESDRDEGKRQNEKREKDGEESLLWVTKQFALTLWQKWGP